jgi:hypothetical protein
MTGRRIRHTRLSINLGASHNQGQCGWALLRETGRLPTERISGDPLTATLAVVAVGEHVDLVCYSDEASFAQSRAAKDGLTRDQHTDLVRNLREQLRQHGRSASITWSTVE